MFRLIILLLAATFAHATSVFPDLHECPVCGLRSVKISLASYSQFGEPERDLSDAPRFRFANVEICPGDLYASWSNGWEKISPDEKAKLAEFLKKPSLQLTESEKAAVAGHEEAFRGSVWFEPLWARTCSEFRTMDEKGKFDGVLQMHFAGRHVDRRESVEKWEEELVSHFREEAITALEVAVAAKWSKPHEKRVFAYLRGELIRQAGRDAEALEIFRKVINSEKSTVPDEELDWISRWAEEQSLRCGPEAKDPGKLLAAVIPELPDPWRKRKSSGDVRWARHYAAVNLLAQRAAEGDKQFSDALWKLLDRKPERLLALLETIQSDIGKLRSVDARWEEWFDEIDKLIDGGKVPASIADDPHKERVINVLSRAVDGNDDGGSDSWQAEVFLPAVRKAAAEGGIPAVEIPEKDLPRLRKKGKGKPSMNDLSRQLYELWKTQAEPVRTDIARVYVRILRMESDDAESTGYPAQYLLPEIAETEFGRAAIRMELDGKWVRTFWKVACTYAARLPDSSEAFIKHPGTAKTDTHLVVELLMQRSDGGWKGVAIGKLNGDEWVSSDIIRYLDFLDLPETRAALEKFADKARVAKKRSRGSLEQMELYSLQVIDDLRLKRGMREFPIR